MPTIESYRVAAAEWKVDRRNLSYVVHVILQGRVCETTSNGRDKETLHIGAAEIDAKFQIVFPRCKCQRILYLVRVVNAELRQVYSQANCRPARRGIKAGQPQIGDLDR